MLDSLNNYRSRIIKKMVAISLAKSKMFPYHYEAHNSSNHFIMNLNLCCHFALNHILPERNSRAHAMEYARVVKVRGKGPTTKIHVKTFHLQLEINAMDCVRSSS